MHFLPANDTQMPGKCCVALAADSSTIGKFTRGSNHVSNQDFNSNQNKGRAFTPSDRRLARAASR